jgi:ElaB/YqjD/DUF883 family membrane-anchored ribosome-binding protein
MSSNVQKLDDAPVRSASSNETAQAKDSKTSQLLGGINDTVQKGVTALKGQYETVKEHGLTGVKDDISSYARNKPLTALAVAGGIGVLAALILRRR